MNNFAYKHPKLEEALQDNLIIDMFWDKAVESVRQHSDHVGELVEAIALEIEATKENILYVVRLMEAIKVQYNDEMERMVNEYLCDEDCSHEY